MGLSVRNRSLLVLVVIAFACSRVIFAFIADPEGPNLLVVTGLATFLWVIAAAAYLSRLRPSLAGFRRTGAAMGIELFAAAGFYLGLR